MTNSVYRKCFACRLAEELWIVGSDEGYGAYGCDDIICLHPTAEDKPWILYKKLRKDSKEFIKRVTLRLQGKISLED